MLRIFCHEVDETCSGFSFACRFFNWQHFTLLILFDFSMKARKWESVRCTFTLQNAAKWQWWNVIRNSNNELSIIERSVYFWDVTAMASIWMDALFMIYNRISATPNPRPNHIALCDMHYVLQKCADGNDSAIAASKRSNHMPHKNKVK